MIPRLQDLKENDRVVFRATSAFLQARLSQSSTIDWALRLKPSDTAKKAAVLDLLDGSAGKSLPSLWLEVWRLIQESWESSPIGQHSSLEVVDIRERINNGERSAALVSAIVKLLAPRLAVHEIPEWHWQIRKRPKRPRKIGDLLSLTLTSVEIVDPKQMGLEDVKDVEFLVRLAHALDASVVAGLDLGALIGWDERFRRWQIGQLDRVYYVPQDQRGQEEDEPDEFHRGIAPSVKLLHFVVSRIAELSPEAARDFISRWGHFRSTIHKRLWSALSRDPTLISAELVVEFLKSLDDFVFWRQDAFPEIAELRAVRFKDLTPADQETIAGRLQKLPPRHTLA